ncbi:MAG TPA: 4'-phosphopantetheinyl transferase superfamily protein [Streptomyces sp.]|nr:4'-phosphopantetheinyl transferase superfamily protein [Streptomyces sp.]
MDDDHAPAPVATGGVELWLLRLPEHSRKGSSAPRPPAPDASPLDLSGLDLSGLDLSVLDDQERARGASFAGPRAAFRYLAAHVLLRRLLAGHLGVTPAQVRYEREPCRGCGRTHGRPVVAGGEGPGFSLSHSGDLVLAAVAVGSGGPVGVDVQQVPSPTTASLCAPRLHPGERAELGNVPYDRLAEAFAQIWVRTEAYLKALGTGLCRPPRRDYLGADATSRPPGWVVHDLPAGPDHSAAVVVRDGTASPGPPAVRRILPGALARTSPSAVPAGRGSRK